MGDSQSPLLDWVEYRSETTWSAFFEEVKAVGFIAAPLAAISLSQFSLQIVSLMIVGHLDELALSSTAIAISLAAVTGFSVVLGMASALETLCGQAYGAKQYQKLGSHTYTAIFCLLVVCLPLILLWINMGNLLILLGQDPSISQEAGKFMIWLIPGLIAYATLHPLMRYFQMQVLVIPMLIFSCLTLCLHIPLCWVLVFKTGLKNLGGALAMSISNWLNVILLASYMKFSPKCAKTRGVISMELFQGIRDFLYFAIPSALMTCLAWWSFEVIILLSGLLPNPQLESSVLSVCFNSMTTVFTLAYGIGSAGSTRVANELGAGKPQAARRAAGAAIFLAVVETIIVSMVLFTLRHVFGYAFSSEKEVVDYVAVMAPLVCISMILDGIQGVLSGIARGCGWQRTGAYINLGAFYLCGNPAAVALGFWANLKGRGLWIGIQIGAFVQMLLLLIVTSRINWKEQAAESRERIFQGRGIENKYEAFE
ncbi:protein DETOXIFICATION 12-like isoform X2 [Momordica charantia]|uniref:Protein DETOXIFICATION n=1 Tax=Momordica charantia TaxID=3673 RepID=A0A6J1D9S8_MOMCH|nr:protein DETOXIFICATION 12-like isoform X2 [Momordica charantia]